MKIINKEINYLTVLTTIATVLTIILASLQLYSIYMEKKLAKEIQKS